MIAIGQRVRVHYNLHRGDFSVSDPKTGKVITNVPSIALSGATFRVSEAARLKCVDAKRRKVHAYVVGVVSALDFTPTDAHKRVTYNPFRSGDFHVSDSGETIKGSGLVGFANAYCYI